MVHARVDEVMVKVVPPRPAPVRADARVRVLAAMQQLVDAVEARSGRRRTRRRARARRARSRGRTGSRVTTAAIDELLPASARSSRPRCDGGRARRRTALLRNRRSWPIQRWITYSRNVQRQRRRASAATARSCGTSHANEPARPRAGEHAALGDQLAARRTWRGSRPRAGRAGGRPPGRSRCITGRSSARRARSTTLRSARIPSSIVPRSVRPMNRAVSRACIWTTRSSGMPVRAVARPVREQERRHARVAHRADVRAAVAEPDERARVRQHLAHDVEVHARVVVDREVEERLAVVLEQRVVDARRAPARRRACASRGEARVHAPARRSGARAIG